MTLAHFYFFLFGGVKDFLPDTPPVRFLSEVFHSGAIAEVSAHSAAEMVPLVDSEVVPLVEAVPAEAGNDICVIINQ